MLDRVTLLTKKIRTSSTNTSLSWTCFVTTARVRKNLGSWFGTRFLTFCSRMLGREFPLSMRSLRGSPFCTNTCQTHFVPQVRLRQRQQLRQRRAEWRFGTNTLSRPCGAKTHLQNLLRPMFCLVASPEVDNDISKPFTDEHSRRNKRHTKFCRF